MNEQRCSNCKHFIENPNEREDGVGQCRRFPPTVVWASYLKESDTGMEGEVCAFFPRVTISMWCGEHAPIDADGVLNTDHPS